MAYRRTMNSGSIVV